MLGAYSKGIAMKFMRFALLAAAMLFVAACLPVTTRNPVGTTTGFKQDPALVGLWKARPDKDDKDDDKQGFIAFLNAGEDGTMTGLMIAPAKGAGDWGYLQAQARDARRQSLPECLGRDE